MTLDVFISYAHKDRKLRDELADHLSNLRNQQVITDWFDGDIVEGTEWESQILVHLYTAQVILLLISASFLSSKFCYSSELTEAIARHNAGQARVIPIILRPVDWKDTSFAKLQALPAYGKPVSLWRSHDEAFNDVVQGIRRAIEDLSKKDDAVPQIKEDGALPHPAEANGTLQSSLMKQWLQPARPKLIKPFVGRQALVDKLLADLTSGQNVNITGRVLYGMGGIGKTYLAMKLAIELYDFFPGGTILISVGPQVTDKASAQGPLRKLASYAFGGFPPDTQFHPEQVAAWLNEKTPGKFLVIFDDLWDAVPLRFLNSALPEHAVQLVTTRSEKVAKSIDANIYRLDRLKPADGLALLKQRLDCQNDTTYQDQLNDLVSLLHGHALALEIAAAQIKMPSLLQTVYRDLKEGIGQGTLASLKLSPDADREENLERSFALSYERLTLEQQRLFRLLGVFAEESIITAVAAAKIWGMDNGKAAQTKLIELADLALLTQIEGTTTDSTSFRQHGLLNVYAKALLEKACELHQVSSIHAQYYTKLCWQVSSETPESLALLDLYMPNLIAALQWTEHNDPSLFLSLVRALLNILLLRGQRLDLFEKYLPKAVTTAGDTGNMILKADLLKSLGDVESHLGKLDEALGHYDAALPLYQAERDHLDLGEANVLKSRGDVESRSGKPDEALGHYDAALKLYQAERNRREVANLLKSLGDVESREGKPDEALGHYDAALPLYQAERDHLGEANVLKSRGDLESREGKLDEALGHYDAALPLYQAERDRRGLANLLKSLGDVESRVGNLDEARSDYDKALELSRDERDRWCEAQVLKSQGDLEFRVENLDEARSLYNEALNLYKKERDHLGESNVLRSRGDLEFRVGNLDEARSLYNKALELSKAVNANWSVANVLRSRGDLKRCVGKLDEARSDYDKALELSQVAGDRWGEANVLKSQGDLAFRLDKLDEARSLYNKALELYKKERNRRGEANIYKSLGDMHIAQEKWAEAETYYEKALPLYTDERDRLGSANTLIDLGRAHFELGDHKQAIQDEERAAELFRGMKDISWAERAEQYLAEMHLKLKQQ